MKLKKFILVIMVISFLPFTNKISLANNNFIDNNVIEKLRSNNPNANITISELNTGKIISKNKENEVVSYDTLINKLLVFTISEQLKEKKITLDTKINLAGTDDILQKYDISQEITVKDAIFLLEQDKSNILVQSTIQFFNYTISDFQHIIDKLTLQNSELVSLEISSENKSTAKNISYLVSETILNFQEITDITKNPTYEFSNGNTADNNIKFIQSDTIRVLGTNYDGNKTTLIAYSGNTKILVTVLNISEDKDSFFDTVQEMYDNIFKNYIYKLALKADTYNINNENISISNDIYDLFYKDHSDKNIKYFLMNNKILLFQNYDYLSANYATVFSTYTSNTDTSNYTKIKNTFIQDNEFSTRSNKEKLDIILDRTQYFAMFVLLIYSAIFIILYILKKPFSKGE
ncbi:hypothetical protein HZY83_06675 [Gemella sp. GH3]|uniref:hypothetical protein n=1 Tax=unclassified Gemella TaxID=2624949 RepID=UPI0015D0C6D5|nr:MULTISPECIES: hypothetical protein [unclassified Gemella]MBF0714357.1 hypothetical protein [Gemella sp. GH3.1]NYS51309.1 hypothetical protein [Gemella sp. GH3]